MWLSAPPHYRMYVPMVQEWNATHSDHYNLVLLSLPALERRMLSAFTSGTPAADLLEVERKPAARAFMGPLEGVGFVDLTDRLKSEGLLDKLNAPSFTPWTSRGRNFGLPHDVHPVMLGYRADIVEAAGLEKIGDALYRLADAEPGGMADVVDTVLRVHFGAEGDYAVKGTMER